jgi:hypothetical protein
MNEPKQYLKKLIKMRKYLVDGGEGFKRDLGTTEAMKKIATWLEFHPKATDRQIRDYIDRNILLVERLLPGKGSRNEETFRNQLNQIRHGEANCN